MANKITREYLENNDFTKQNKNFDDECCKNDFSNYIEKTINDIDIDNLSPMKAFNILLELKEKIKEN